MSFCREEGISCGSVIVIRYQSSEAWGAGLGRVEELGEIISVRIKKCSVGSILKVFEHLMIFSLSGL